MEIRSLLIALLFALAATPSAAAPPEEEWYVLRSGTEQRPHILSVRPSLPGEKTRAVFPVQVTLRWEYEANDTGLPAAEADLKALYAFERQLRSRDAAEVVYLDAIRRTGDGERTWIVFARSQDAFMDLLGEEPRLEVTFRQDPAWSELSAILDAVAR